ncbi:hypothetical protein OY671_011037, partial [Metschnikowia pulcherrima]
HELQEKLLQQQQQAKSPRNGKGSPTATSAPGGVEQVNSGQASGIAGADDSYSYPKQSMTSFAESVNLGGSNNSSDVTGGKNNKKTWNWSSFGGSSKSVNKAPVQQAPPSQPQMQPFVAMTFDAPPGAAVAGNPATGMSTALAPSANTDSDRSGGS